MKLLLLADLHSRQDWFDWIAEAKVDATLIAGDLLDGFSPSGLLPQMVAVRHWVDRLRYPLALCSGNHDANFSEAIGLPVLDGMDPITKSLALAPRWIDTLARPSVLVDGRSEIADWGGQKVIVSTIPYAGFDDEHLTDSLWDAGDRLRREHRLPWFVLHHEPPAGTSVGGSTGDSLLPWKIVEFQPDYVISGHLHEQPSIGSFADRIGKTWCFNAGAPSIGQVEHAGVPNHIVIDTATQTAIWFATPTTGPKLIQESICLR